MDAARKVLLATADELAMSSPQVSSTSSSDTDVDYPSSSRSSSPGPWDNALSAWLAPDSGWDLSGDRELSHLLKLATAQAHKDVLRPAVVNKLITGNIPLETHIQYLMMLYDVYDALESALARHADDPLLAPIFKPAVLDRAPSIADDIAWLLSLPPGQKWQSHPIAQRYRDSPPAALTDYVKRVQALEQDGKVASSSSIDYVYPRPPAEAYLLLSHAYVRYMGDLNGGQSIKQSVAKAYHLDTEATDGLRFYRFENDDGLPASPAELSKIAAEFKKGMNAVGERLTPEQRAALLQEANHAFELNIRLFSSFSEMEDPEAQALLAPPSSSAPKIPSPSLEGYAKAAAYMPKSKISPVVAKAPVNNRASPWYLWALFAVAFPISLALYRQYTLPQSA